MNALPLNSQPSSLNHSDVWDGDWAILEEYDQTGARVQGYVEGYHGLVKTLVDNIYYYQDELGSTSHIANASGALLEWYKYDLNGKPTYWSAATPSTQLQASSHGVEVLGDGGARWRPELGLYDDRNRFMSPDSGRFLQPDPIGFKGDASNLYRYCGNDWANRTDLMGTDSDPNTHANTMWQQIMHNKYGDHSQDRGDILNGIGPHFTMNFRTLKELNMGFTMGNTPGVKFTYTTSIDTPTVSYLGRTFNGGMKTTQTVEVDPENARIMSASKSVGTTYEFDKSGNVIGTGTASGSSIQQSITRSGNQTVLNMRGNEKNPLVSGAPGITYSATVTFNSRNHNYDWKVTHDAFPSHRFSGPQGDLHSFDHTKAGTSPFRLFPFTPSVHDEGTSTY